jgi:hypothetical protein
MKEDEEKPTIIAMSTTEEDAGEGREGGFVFVLSARGRRWLCRRPATTFPPFQFGYPILLFCTLLKA